MLILSNWIIRKRTKVYRIPFTIIVFNFVALLWMIYGLIRNRPTAEVVRDSFIFFYSLFIFVGIHISKKITTDRFIIRIASLVKIALFLLFCFTFLQEALGFPIPVIPGTDGVYIFYLKHGDLAVFLAIFYILYQEGKIKYQANWRKILSFTCFMYLMITAFSHNKGGMLAFTFAVIIYHILIKRIKVKMILLSIPILALLISATLLLSKLTQKNQDFQGRSTSIDQVLYNFTFLFNSDENSTSSDNMIWRIVWWQKIINYTFGGPYFFSGKGVGFSLAISDDVPYQADQTSIIRSPHNINMTVLARYGVIVFFIWITFIIGLFRNLFLKMKDIKVRYIKIFSIFCIAIYVNANFDVYLEGPMGALPFWVFIGLIIALKSERRNAKT